MALRLTSPFFNSSSHSVNSFDDDFRRMNTLFKSLERTMEGDVDQHGIRTVTPNYHSHIDEHCNQTIELEMPGAKKDGISIDLDQNERVLSIIGNRYSFHKFGKTKVEVKNDKKDSSRKEENRKQDDKQDRLSIVYKWKGNLNGMVQMKDVHAEHCEHGILRIVLKCRMKNERMRIEIKDA